MIRHKPTQPVRLTTLDGEERQFLLTLGSLKRLKARMASIEQADGLDYYTALIYASIFPWQKGGPALTEDELAEVLPADLEFLSEFAAQLQENSGLNPKKQEGVTSQPSTPTEQSSTDGPSGASSSDSQAMNTTT